MKKTALTLLSALVATGCVEYDIASPGDIRGMNNPRELVTPVNSDAIVQVTTPMADVLFVVDDSSSMEPEQTQLAESFPKFLDYFLGSGLDYHIGVISTDYPNDKGKLESGLGELWITDETQNPQGVFQDMAEMGGFGDSYESGMGTSYAAIELQQDEYNAGYYRDDASLHVIVMTDENDWTQQYGLITVEEYISWMTTLKPSADMVSFNSIINQIGCCGGNTSPFSETAGTRYLELTNGIGGINWDVKSDNWDQVLEQLGMQAAGLSREFFLTQLPVPGSITVFVEEDAVEYQFAEGDDWTYSASRNSVTFAEYIPTPLSRVKIQYEVLATENL
jgi:hypothetical protein